jgi:hypothetical protein
MVMARWWDSGLESRDRFARQIQMELEQARVVVVLWSSEAIESRWVYSEAQYADHSGKFVNVCVPGTPLRELPLPFNTYHVDNSDDTHSILGTIASVMRGTPVRTRVPLAGVRATAWHASDRSNTAARAQRH